MVGGELHTDQIDDIVNQLRVFGLKAVTEITSTRAFIPFVFNLNQPIKEDHIRWVMSKNEGILVEQGKERRSKAAIIMDETVANAVANQFAQNGITKEATQKFEMEIEQLEQSEAGEKRIEEGYRIDPKAPPPAGAKPAKAAPKKRSRSQAGA